VCVRMCVQIRLHEVRLVAVRCNLDRTQLQHVSVRGRLLQLVMPDFQSQGRRFDSCPAHSRKHIDLAVNWVLGRPGIFLNTVGDVTLLPKVLAARVGSHPGRRTRR